MPKILLFAACEKIIIDGKSSTPSLISIFENLEIGLAGDMEIPADTTIPTQWDVLSMWLRTPDDMEQQFEQRIHLVLPDGKEAAEAIMPFAMLNSRQNNVANVTGFPVGQKGICSLVLSFRKAGTDDSWEKVAEYPINVVHLRQPAS